VRGPGREPRRAWREQGHRRHGGTREAEVAVAEGKPQSAVSRAFADHGERVKQAGPVAHLDHRLEERRARAPPAQAPRH
jgi:hypothetical protein